MLHHIAPLGYAWLTITYKAFPCRRRVPKT